MFLRPAAGRRPAHPSRTVGADELRLVRQRILAQRGCRDPLTHAKRSPGGPGCSPTWAAPAARGRLRSNWRPRVAARPWLQATTASQCCQGRMPRSVDALRQQSPQTGSSHSAKRSQFLGRKHYAQFGFTSIPYHGHRADSSNRTASARRCDQAPFGIKLGLDITVQSFKYPPPLRGRIKVGGSG
jgi:hypothetical protein